MYLNVWGSAATSRILPFTGIYRTLQSCQMQGSVPTLTCTYPHEQAAPADVLQGICCIVLLHAVDDVQMLHVDTSKLDVVSDTGRNIPCDAERPRSSIGYLMRRSASTIAD